MALRWRILAVLFLARTAMGFQFQSVGALAPLMLEEYGLGLADIGLLVGLYLAPGIAIALPGGAIAARWGDKRVVTLGLGLMALGGALTLLASDLPALIVGRVVAGVGGVILNVIMTKMITDWFAGREIATAMSIFINSWPLGITLALLTLPGLAAAGGIGLSLIGVAGFIVVAGVLFALYYRPAPVPAAAVNAARQPGSSQSSALPLGAVLCAGSVWGAFNAALIVVISFGPLFLTGLGWGLSVANSAASTLMLCLAIVGPFGGMLADRSGRVIAVISVSMVSFTIGILALFVAPEWGLVLLFAILGACAGLGAGPIMSLPAQVLDTDRRALGMGVFFTAYYAFMLVGPWVAGWLAEVRAEVTAALFFAVALQAVSIAALWGFARLSAARV